MQTQSTHGGNIWPRLRAADPAGGRRAGKSPREIMDFSANINPLGPPDSLRSIIGGQIENLVHYPDPECSQLTGAIAQHFAIKPQQVVCGNGSSELLYALPRALSVKRALLPAPCYVDYARAAQAAGMAVLHILPESFSSLDISFKRLETQLRGNEIVFLGQPNNPTGFLFDSEAFISLAKKRKNTFFVVDEAFADFIEGYGSVIRQKLPNVLALRSMTKFFAVPGLRLGALLGPQKIIESIHRILPFWSVNHLAQMVCIDFLADRDYAVRTRKFIRERREELCRRLSAMPCLFAYPGVANYLLVRIEHDQIDAVTLRKQLLERNIMIRACADFAGLDKRFFRVAVRNQEENECLCDALTEIFGSPHVVAVRGLDSIHGSLKDGREGSSSLPPSRSPLRWAKEGRSSELCSGGVGPSRPRSGGRMPRRGIPTSKRPPALMLQGTCSGAGKSVLTAAFCRILLQDGFRVAPFKAQNMALNSFVTPDGGELGRAQALQAQACRLEADVRMNPVLLKPNSDTGTQVIILGKPVGNMDVDQYIRFKPEAFKSVKQAYDQLVSEYDVIVLEGAGSPAEVNLKSHDIVNMAMARYAGARVLIAGDIDRGGVFAAFAGTFDLLNAWERNLVAGFVVNRFRGQTALLAEALDFIARYTGRPVLGVVPYLADLHLPEEDSVAFKGKACEKEKHPSDAVTMAVIDLPHISNFTDFDALYLEPDVAVRIVRRGDELGAPDIIILPGSKNVAQDLAYLRAAGFERKILEAARNDRTELMGICAGLQMLGREIYDPHHIESDRDTVSGLGILPLTTTLCATKTLRRVAGRHTVSGLPVQGYEIHHGQSKSDGLLPAIRRHDGEVIGFQSRNALAGGTYLHGLFDADEFRRWFIDRARERKGLAPLGRIQARYDLEPALDRLAEVVRESVRMEEIYKMLGLD